MHVDVPVALLCQAVELLLLGIAYPPTALGVATQLLLIFLLQLLLFLRCQTARPRARSVQVLIPMWPALEAKGRTRAGSHHELPRSAVRQRATALDVPGKAAAHLHRPRACQLTFAR